jgi:hypothetical protein
MKKIVKTNNLRNLKLILVNYPVNKKQFYLQNALKVIDFEISKIIISIIILLFPCFHLLSPLLIPHLLGLVF